MYKTDNLRIAWKVLVHWFNSSLQNCGNFKTIQERSTPKSFYTPIRVLHFIHKFVHAKQVYCYLVCTDFIAVCKDSYVINACGFDQVGKWLGYTESMRISINRMILRQVCYLAVDHWRGKTLLWYSVILEWYSSNSWWILNDSVILKWFSSDSFTNN